MKKFIIVPLFALFLTACGGGDDLPVVQEQPKPELACEAGTSEYSLENTPLEFCYNDSWGAPVVEAQPATAGEMTLISFAENDGIKIWIESADYEGADSFIDYAEFRPTDSPDGVVEQLRELLEATGGEIKVRKGDAGRVRAIRADLKYSGEDSINYFVKDAFDGFHVTFRSGRDMAGDLDDFVFDVSL